MRVRAPNSWFARWAMVLFLGSVGIAASCGGGSDDAGSPASGGRSSSSGSGGSVISTGGQGSGGTTTSSDAGASAGGEAGAPGAAGSAGAAGDASGGRDPVTDAGSKTYPDVTFTYDAGVGPPLTEDAACAKSVLETAPTPLDIYVVLDRSGSMNLPHAMPSGPTSPGAGDCNVGDAISSRWCNAINALDGFFGSTEAEGSGIALQFFPQGDCTSSPNPIAYACCSSGECCGGAQESTPEVALGLLPEVRGELVEALNAQIPWADRTPIEAALRGLVSYTAKAARPGRQMMGLLITDGGPEGCLANQNSLARFVQNHRTKTKIPTYVVATQGAAYSWLEPIAIAGGAPAHDTYCAGGVKPCHFYDVGTGRPDVFIDVLQQIRRAAIACQFKMPRGDDGLVNPSEVTLSVTPGSGGPKLSVELVANEAACADGSGFFYDNPKDPEHLSLCPASCDALREGDGGKVEILVGCKGS